MPTLLGNQFDMTSSLLFVWLCVMTEVEKGRGQEEGNFSLDVMANTAMVVAGMYVCLYEYNLYKWNPFRQSSSMQTQATPHTRYYLNLLDNNTLDPNHPITPITLWLSAALAMSPSSSSSSTSPAWYWLSSSASNMAGGNLEDGSTPLSSVWSV